MFTPQPLSDKDKLSAPLPLALAAAPEEQAATGDDILDDLCVGHASPGE